MSTSAIIGALRVSLGLDTAAFEDGLSGAQAKLRTAGAALAKAGAAMSVVSTGLLLGIKGQLNAADELGKTAQKIGIPVDALSRLGYAAELSDVSMGTLQTSLGRLAKNMVGFGEDADGAVKAFQAVGVSATDSEGNLRSTEAVIADLAEAFSHMEDGPAKTAAAMALFGKAGAEMIPLLNEGAEAIRAMGAEADAMGVVITPEMAASAEIFNDNITRLTTTMSGFGTMIAADLAPTLASLSEWVVDVSTNFQNLDPNLRQFISIGAGIAVVLGPALTALGLMALALSAISLPVLAVVAGLAAATAAIIAFWPELEAAHDAINAFADGLRNRLIADLSQLGVELVAAKDAVIAFGTDALDWIKAKPAEIAAAFTDLRAQMVTIGRDIFSGLLEGLTARWEGIKTSITGWAQSIGAIFRSETQTQSPSQVMAAIGQDIIAGLGVGMDSMQGDIKSGVQGFANSISNAFANILTEGGSFRDALQSLLSQSIGSIGGGLLDKGIGSILGAMIPGFANGTNSAPGGLALVGERGPEVVNLPRGSRVTPNEALGSSVSLTFAPTINAPNSDAAGLARVRAEMRELADGMHQKVLGVISDPRAQRAR